MKRFLQHIYAERFGGLAGRSLGPFGPGLNVVQGPNEAGKSTFAALVGGVLFGWEDAHGVRNRFVPAEGGRAGRLEWATAGAAPDDAPGPDNAPVARCPRPPASRAFGQRATGALSGPGALSGAVLARDEAGATGDLAVADDVDRATFEAVFSFSAEELRSLRGSSDVTSQLLAAESGTVASPAQVFVEIERRIAGTAVYELERELEDVRARMKEAAAREELRLQEDRELRELAMRRESTAARIGELNAELEDLIARRAELESIDERAARLEGELVELRESREALNWDDADSAGDTLLELDAAGDRALRERLDDLAEEQEKIGRALDIAKENSASSTAAYEALCELDEEEVAASRRLRNRSTPAVVAALLPVAFIIAGVPLFVHGRQINSLSITALGVGLVVVAVFLAVAAFFVMFRQPKGAEGLDGRRKDAQWIMLQDRKKLDSCTAEQASFRAGVAEFLEGAGLGAADGSIRQARSLLDEARDARAARAEDAQKAAALASRINVAERELGDLTEARAALNWGDVNPDRVIREKTEQRDALVEAAADMGERFGELARGLEAAREDRSFDAVKFEYQQIRARLREAKGELIELLIARRVLERSIAAWEHQSQPEVYERAGQLLATITDGRWTGVSTSASGSLVAVGADGVTRDPRHLSLGTCQQLYLALRIALLLTAQDVGRAIPVLADDILVNFDAARRRGAARALAELAESRQVIVFTCHEETACVLQEFGAMRIDL